MNLTGYTINNIDTVAQSIDVTFSFDDKSTANKTVFYSDGEVDIQDAVAVKAAMVNYGDAHAALKNSIPAAVTALVGVPQTLSTASISLGPSGLAKLL